MTRITTLIASHGIILSFSFEKANLFLKETFSLNQTISLIMHVSFKSTMAITGSLLTPKLPRDLMIVQGRC